MCGWEASAVVTTATTTTPPPRWPTAGASSSRSLQTVDNKKRTTLLCISQTSLVQPNRNRFTGVEKSVRMATLARVLLASFIVGTSVAQLRGAETGISFAPRALTEDKESESTSHIRKHDTVQPVTDTRLKEEEEGESEEEKRLFGWIGKLAREVEFARSIRAEKRDMATILPSWEKQKQLMQTMAEAKSRDTKKMQKLAKKLEEKIRRMKLKRYSLLKKHFYDYHRYREMLKIEGSAVQNRGDPRLDELIEFGKFSRSHRL